MADHDVAEDRVVSSTAGPAVTLEIGCGRLGGFVPKLRANGYDGVGIDPVAPEADCYRRVEFEQSDLPPDMESVIACTSLHHVAEPGEVLEKVANGLAPGGLVIVVEWDWEGFDEATARWCFERLGRRARKLASPPARRVDSFRASLGALSRQLG